MTAKAQRRKGTLRNAYDGECKDARKQKSTKQEERLAERAALDQLLVFFANPLRLCAFAVRLRP